MPQAVLKATVSAAMSAAVPHSTRDALAQAAAPRLPTDIRPEVQEDGLDPTDSADDGASDPPPPKDPAATQTLPPTPVIPHEAARSSADALWQTRSEWVAALALPTGRPDGIVTRKDARPAAARSIDPHDGARDADGVFSAAGPAAFARTARLDPEDQGSSGDRRGNDHDAHRFGQALRAAASSRADSGALPSPFELLGAPARQTAHTTSEAAGNAPVAPAPIDAQLYRRIGDVVERLMVGDGRSGNRQVRMDVKEDLLPGVTITVQELDGRLEVDFTCVRDEPRQRLAESAPDHAQMLATRLARDVLVRVQASDGADPTRVEFAATPSTLRRTRS